MIENGIHCAGLEVERNAGGAKLATEKLAVTQRGSVVQGNVRGRHRIVRVRSGMGDCKKRRA